MANCTMCGQTIPDSQTVCSMCYGDPAFGADYYYQRFLEEVYRQEDFERQQAENDYMPTDEGDK